MQFYRYSKKKKNNWQYLAKNKKALNYYNVLWLLATLIWLEPFFCKMLAVHYGFFVSDRSFVDEYIWKRMTLLENMWRLQWRQICCYIPCKRPRSVSRMEGYVGDAGNWLKRGSLASQNEILKLNCWWNVWLYKNKNLSYDVLCS